MSDIKNQHHNQGDHEKAVNDKRRSFTKAGIAAPIVMTLASRPVFGATCLSDMLSSNLSNHAHQSVCLGGFSPEILASPDSIPTWEMAGFVYGFIPKTTKRELATLDTKKRQLKQSRDSASDTVEDSKTWEAYQGGDRFNQHFTRHSDPENRHFREVLNGSGSEEFKILIAGAINAAYFESFNGSDPTKASYIFSVEEFWQIYHGNLKIPNNVPLTTYIEASYRDGP